MASAMRRIGSFLGLSDEIEMEEVTETPSWAKSDVRVRENRTSLTSVNSVSTRVTPAVFLLSPANVTISADVKSSAAEASFFNQS